MCGIAGFVGVEDQAKLERMTAAIAHRGPDDSGFLLRSGVGLGHARLSIIDTSPAGHQPMELRNGSVAIVLNGEIYNFKELRAELAGKGVAFASHSDTEVILHLYKEKGLACFKDLAGMFAIALYDFQNERLVLARDRMGEKPLYWNKTTDGFCFGSELKALVAGGMERTVSQASLEQYLAFDYIPTPFTIWAGVFKLEPGTYLVYEKGEIAKHAFWTPPAQEETLTLPEAVKKLDETLSKVVARELISDVPLGIFLSGGIDSSTIAYYAQKASARPVETFSMGFEDASFDESRYAALAAKYLGTSHHSHPVSSADALELVPTLGDVFDEPVADASVIPTLLLSEFTRQSVTVALGGDGGDELFAGYPTFFAESAYSLYKLFPRFGQLLLKQTADLLPVSHANFPFSYTLMKFASVRRQDPTERHLEWLGTFDESARRTLGLPGADVFEQAHRFANEYRPSDQGNRLLWTYARTYLMDQVMVKVDRSSMRYALETRAPFLDHEVVELLFSLPYGMKYRTGQGKYLLKRLMRGKLPDDIIDRKKKGFGVPLARWLAGPLRDLCTDLLSEDRIQKQGIFRPKAVTTLVEAHMDKRRDNRKELWNLMVFEMWYDRWMR